MRAREIDRLRGASTAEKYRGLALETASGPGGCVITRPPYPYHPRFAYLCCDQHDTERPPAPRTDQTGDMSRDKVVERTVRIPTAGVSLDGDLAVPLRRPAALCSSPTEVAAVPQSTESPGGGRPPGGRLGDSCCWSCSRLRRSRSTCAPANCALTSPDLRRG